MDSVMAAETPLQDLLRRIPRDAVLRWETPEEGREPWQLGWSSSPVGRLAHEAADRLDAAPPPPAEAPALGVEDVARIGWEAGRAWSVEMGEEDCGPWPPTAGHFGWQEDDAEACRDAEMHKAQAILAAMGRAGE